MTRILFFCSLCTLLGLPVQAQPTLSVSEALAIGLQNNFQIRIARINETIADRNNTWGQAGMLPQLTLSLNQTNSFNNQDNPASFLNGLYSIHALQPTVDLDWTVFSGFRARITKQQLQLLEEQSRGNAALVVENTIQGILLAYYNAVLQHERLKTLEQVRQVSRDEHRYFKDRVELGASTTFDLLQAYDAYLTDSTNALNQEWVLTNAQRDLNRLLALPLDTSFVLSDSVLPDIEVLNYPTLYERTFQTNRTLKNEYLNILLKEEDVRLRQADRYPRVSIRGGIGDTRSWFIREGNTAEGELLNYYANFALSYTLYNGGQISRSIENAYDERDLAQLQYEDLEQQVEQELQQQYTSYTNRVQLLGIARESVKNARLNLELAQGRYQTGSITSFEFRDIQIRFRNTSLQALQTAYDLLSSRVELLRLTGDLVSVPGNTP